MDQIKHHGSQNKKLGHKFKSCHANLKLKSQDTNKNLDKKSLRSGHSEKYPARPTFSSSNLKKKKIN